MESLDKSSKKIQVLEFEQMRAMGFEDVFGNRLTNVDLDVSRIWQNESMPEFGSFDALILSGGSLNVPNLTDEPRFFEYIRLAINKDVPILGVCLGHQILGHILGGTVISDPKRSENGYGEIVLNEKGAVEPMFNNFPHKFYIPQFHENHVNPLPSSGLNLANSSLSNHQAVSYVGRKIWGVQFHPELSLEHVSMILKSKNLDLKNYIPEDIDVQFQGELRIRFFQNFLDQI